ncbi:MAG: hypothetical protein QOH05_1243 [Acetobacteraceae bacterium]|nr:hypothetical protein [Acetobacteraceae bacterium]
MRRETVRSQRPTIRDRIGHALDESNMIARRHLHELRGCLEADAIHIRGRQFLPGERHVQPIVALLRHVALEPPAGAGECDVQPADLATRFGRDEAATFRNIVDRHGFRLSSIRDRRFDQARPPSIRPPIDLGRGGAQDADDRMTQFLHRVAQADRVRAHVGGLAAGLAGLG